MWKSCALVAVCGLGIASCATSRPSPAKEARLEDQARNTIAEMEARQPNLENVVRSAHAFAVFPDIGRAGAFVAGGAYGKGVLFEHGEAVGYVELKQGSIGPQLGGDTFAELIVLPDASSVDKLKTGRYEIGADVSAVVLQTGAHGTAEISSTNLVFVMPRGGLMADLSITGQKIDYLPGT